MASILNAISRAPSHLNVCLAMIIGNDSDAVVARCLKSVRSHITSFCISCNGRDVDDVIKTSLQGIPGRIIKSKWIDFSTNRNEVFELAKDLNSDYIMTIDADEELLFTLFPPAFNHDVYMCEFVSQGRTGLKPILIKADYPGRWSGRVHENLQEMGSWDVWHNAAIRSHDDGARFLDPARVNNDLRMLFADIQDNPKNPRPYYYLGETYLLAGDIDQAEKAYRMRVGFQGCQAERKRSIDRLKQIEEIKNASKSA